MPSGGQDDPTILIWDILAKSPICVCKKTFDRPFVATKLKFTPHFDHVFMVGGQDAVHVWNLDERTKKATNFIVPLGMDYFNNWTWNSISTKEWYLAAVQVILSEIDCAIFYTNLHELFCQFIEQTGQILVNLWTITDYYYYVKLWLIWKKFTTIS